MDYSFYFTQVDNFPEDQVKFLDLLAAHYDNRDPTVPSGHVSVKSLFTEEIKAKNIEKYKNLVHVSDSLNHINSYYHNTEALAAIYTKENRPKEAIQSLEKAEKKIAHLQKPHLLLGVYQNLVNNYIFLNDYPKAYEYREKEYTTRDSIISEQMRINVVDLEVKYEAEKKDRQIAEQSLEIEKKQSQKKQLWIILTAVTILSLLAGLFFIRRLYDQRTITAQKETLHKQKITELEQKNKLLSLNSMIEGQETERLRIAQDLHDSLGGLLSSVKAHFTTIQNEIKTLEKLNITHKTNTLIDEACVEVRRISHNMIPHALTISGVEGALEDMAEALVIEGYEVDLSIRQFPSKVAKEKQAMLYRLIQELISNIKKHANAKHILIQVFGVDEGIGLVIEDDGSGFDYEEAMQKKGVGLKSINSRVTFLKGTIDWSTTAGQGTTVTINIPKL